MITWFDGFICDSTAQLPASIETHKFPLTVKLLYNDHPRDSKSVAIVDMWSFFRGCFMLWRLKFGLQNGGR
jgi:hypothetical protein